MDQIEESIGMGAGRRDASGALPARPRARRWRRWLLLAPLLFVLGCIDIHFSHIGIEARYRKAKK
ncbi:hypothetical protein [Xanthomonas sontii]|uniref:hypothetical protein n=1 Tax=Xanthomonas sontii TaxID=2650745 RepID=UPI0027F91523|nr:hypothetical protein [Xanthomonas sontii]MDQ7761805.1 hypothetical protein [Xanthomonas sontii]